MTPSKGCATIDCTDDGANGFPRLRLGHLAGWRRSFWPSRDDAGTDLGSFIHLLRYPLTDFRLDALRRLFSSTFINLFVLLFGRPFLFDLPLLPIGFLHRVDCSVPPKDKYGAAGAKRLSFLLRYLLGRAQR
jgi:hypothetical protein